MSIQTLHFYTTGEAFSKLLSDLFLSGEFKKVIESLHPQLPKEVVKDYLLGKYYFEGDTRDEEGLSLIPQETKQEVVIENLLTGYRGCVTSYNTNVKRYSGLSNIQLVSNFKKVEDLLSLLTIFTFEEVQELIAVPLLLEKGWKIANPLERNGDGVILQDGTFIACGYQEHRYLYEDLYELGLSTDSCWTGDEKTIHLSSHSISGTVANQVQHHFKDDSPQPTDAQLKALFTNRENIHGIYGREDGTIMYNLLNYFTDITEKGGKFNNLTFLKYFYSNVIKLPQFSLSIDDIDGDKVFIRTSPKKSLPGLLNSRLISKTEPWTIVSAIEEIEVEFSKCLGLLSQQYLGGIRKDDNELHYFYQEFIDGDNGVCHYDSEGFRFQVSSNQGDIVQGKKGNTILEYETENKLRRLVKELYKDIERPLQIEFVVTPEQEIYIVQLRLLKNHFEKTVIIHRPNSGVVADGFTFSKGHEEVKVEDILIVESDGGSELLLGKKALIVESNVEFSHLLALSKALGIPSIYNTGKVDLTGIEKVDFVAYNKEAWITLTEK